MLQELLTHAPWWYHPRLLLWQVKYVFLEGERLVKITHFTIRSRHTAGRTFLCPYGFTRHKFVEVGNVLATRCILLLIVAAWRKLRFLLEQPHGSCMEDLPEFQWLLSVLQVGGWGPMPLTAFTMISISISISYLSLYIYIHIDRDRAIDSWVTQQLGFQSVSHALFTMALNQSHHIWGC